MKTQSLRRSELPSLLRMLTLAIGVLTALTGCTTVATGNTAALPPPKLVVFLVVDGLPQRQLMGVQDQLAPDGFARFLNRGTWFANAHYDHAFTVTAAGHAVMMTGANPNRSGIIGNEWRNPDTGAPVYNTEDLSATYIGHATKAFDGTSAKNLKVQTVGDVLRASTPASKVIAISGKDRGAILPAGKSGIAYMYMAASGNFASTTHYMAQHPTWVDQYQGSNQAGKPADRYFRSEWKPLLPEAAYARSLPDNQPWFGPGGGALPMALSASTDDAPSLTFYNRLMRSPFGDALTLDFARAAIAGEQLGQRNASDILAISLSSHDYINHAYSAESRLSHDHLLQLDRLLAQFFADLDKTIGKDNYVAMLTADHGFMPAPEASSAQGLPSGRLSSSQLLARINSGLEKKFGEGKWVMGFSGSSLLLDKKLMSAKSTNPPAVADEARTLLLAEPAMAAAYTRTELLANQLGSSHLFKALRKSWHPDVSGDVQYALKPNWMFTSATSIATHGSPYDYDTHVPLLIYGPRWYKTGRVDARVEITRIAPTLARLLGVTRPEAAEAAVLPTVVP